MKFSWLLLATLFTLVLSTPVKKDGVLKDRAFLEKQKHVLKLLYRINQPSPFEEYQEITRTYSVAEHRADFTNQDVVKEFLEYYRQDAFLPRSSIFTTMHEEHKKQAIVLTKLFLYAKDWEAFLTVSAWARHHLNERMFVYAFSVAVLHRTDTKDIVLPAIYEITPHFFFNDEVMHQASFFKQIYDGDLTDSPYVDPSLPGFTIESNYSGWYLNLHPESMSYYLEDIDLNAMNYYVSLLIPSWMNSEELKLETHKRGQVFLAILQQLLARWNMERLSNGFGEVTEIDVESPVEVSFTPSLSYPNGLRFPSRPAFADLRPFYTNYQQKWSTTKYSYSLAFVEDYEKRIVDAIDRGLAMADNHTFVELNDEEGLNVLGNLIQCNNDSINQNYYGPINTYARHLLGYTYLPLDSNRMIPSVLQHYETSLRDPVIYQWMKKIINWAQRYINKLPPYTEEQLVIEGIKITGVKIGPLVTYMDYFDVDMANGIWYNKNEKPGSLRMRVRQIRMNHKPFTYKLSINSDREQKVIVKMFLGPKYDEYGRNISLTENRLNFITLDYFETDLKTGENVITHSSHEFSQVVPERLPYWRLWRMVDAALNGTGDFNIPQQNSLYWPQRLLLPCGSVEGTPYQFFFFVYPVQNEEIQRHYQDPFKNLPSSHYPVLYPLNRPIKFEKMWESLPNALFHEQKIYYEDVYDLNVLSRAQNF